MTVEDVLREHRARIRASLPPDVDVSSVEFEGALLVIYTKHPDKFADLGEDVRRLAKTLQKRIIVRPDASALTEIDEAEKSIRKIVPKEAELTNIYWEPDIGEVTIEVAKPGLAIGPGGSLLNDIKRAIGWAPKIIRTPPVQSKTVAEIRGYNRQVAEERKRILRSIGRRLHRGTTTQFRPWLRMLTLGGYREEGRCCSMLQTQDSKVLVDCGTDHNFLNPGMPELQMSEVSPLAAFDAIVITNGTLDRAGLVPWLFENGYDGPVYCTAPTRDLMTLLQLDYVRQATALGAKPLYSAESIRESLKHVIPLNYGDTTDIAPDLRLTLYNAGYVLGSSIAHFHVGDGLYNIAFTGDIRYERSALFNPAHNRFPRCEAIVMEAAYGGPKDFQLGHREAFQALRDVVDRTLKRMGNVLIPVYPGARAQEVMMALDEIMEAKRLPDLKIYLDGLVAEATAIHTAYPEFLNPQVRSQVFQAGHNPLTSPRYERVDNEERRKEVLESEEPRIVLATHAMLEGGPVIDYLRAWGKDENSTLLFVGANADGTLGLEIERGRREIPGKPSTKKLKKGEEPKPPEPVQLKIDVAMIDAFSGHSDRRQLMNYVGNMEPRPDRVVIQQGSGDRCIDLSAALHRKYGVDTRALMNLESVRYR